MLLALLAASLVAPDTSGVISLSTKWGFGHACPVSETLAFTASHVIDVKPFTDYHLLEGIWSDGSGNAGQFGPLNTYSAVDLGRIAGTFPKWYPVASEPPKIGEHLWVVGFDWRGRDKMFQRRVWDLEVLRVVAGMVIVKPATSPGSSGSCALNAKGEAVGILTFSMDPDGGSEGDRVGGIVGLWFMPKEELVPPKKEEEPSGN